MSETTESAQLQVLACERAEAALSEAIGKVWEAVRAIEPDPRDGRPRATRAQIVSRDLTVLVSQLSRGRYAVEDLRHNLAVEVADDGT